MQQELWGQRRVRSRVGIPLFVVFVVFLFVPVLLKCLHQVRVVFFDHKQGHCTCVERVLFVLFLCLAV